MSNVDIDDDFDETICYICYENLEDKIYGTTDHPDDTKAKCCINCISELLEKNGKSLIKRVPFNSYTLYQPNGDVYWKYGQQDYDSDDDDSDEEIMGQVVQPVVYPVIHPVIHPVGPVVHPVGPVVQPVVRHRAKIYTPLNISIIVGCIIGMWLAFAFICEIVHNYYHMKLLYNYHQCVLLITILIVSIAFGITGLATLKI